MSNEWRQNEFYGTAEFAVGEKVFTIPRLCSLEGFAELNASAGGLDLHRLTVKDAIQLSTENSEYRVVLLNPAELRVRIQGGSYFAEPTEAVIRGATAGGAMLRMGWISVGLRVELVYYPARGQAQNLLTSPVRRLLLERVQVQTRR